MIDTRTIERAVSRGKKLGDDLKAIEGTSRWVGARRLNISAGQKAMAHALIYPEAKRGRGNKEKGAESAKFSKRRLQEAQQVLAFYCSLTLAVRDGPYAKEGDDPAGRPDRKRRRWAPSRVDPSKFDLCVDPAQDVAGDGLIHNRRFTTERFW